MTFYTFIWDNTPHTFPPNTLARARARHLKSDSKSLSNPKHSFPSLSLHLSLSSISLSLSLSLSLYPFSRSSSSLLYLTLPSETVRSIQGKAIQCKLTSIMIIWNVHIKQLDLYLLSIFSYLNGIWRFFFSAFSVAYVLGLFIALIIFWIRVSLGLVEFLHLHVDVFFF